MGSRSTCTCSHASSFTLCFKAFRRSGRNQPVFCFGSVLLLAAENLRFLARCRERERCREKAEQSNVTVVTLDQSNRI